MLVLIIVVHVGIVLIIVVHVGIVLIIVVHVGIVLIIVGHVGIVLIIVGHVGIVCTNASAERNQKRNKGTKDNDPCWAPIMAAASFVAG